MQPLANVCHEDPKKKEAENLKESLFFMSTSQWTYEVSPKGCCRCKNLHGFKGRLDKNMEKVSTGGYGLNKSCQTQEIS